MAKLFVGIFVINDPTNYPTTQWLNSPRRATMSTQILDDLNALGQYLEMLGDDGAEFVIEIIDTFLEDAPNNFNYLDQSMAQNDFVTFRRAAHTLKTGCATVGAKGLAQDLLKLEEAGAANNLSAISGLVERCKINYQQLKSELEQQKQNLK
jgi:HPt (histidine-containing phosphotransfer) domain-containing protein